MKKFYKSLLCAPHNDRGSSLVEVIVASVIMSLIGLALVTVTVGAKPLAERFNSKSIALSSLTFAAKQIQMQAIQDTNCSSNDKIQPYYFGSYSTKGEKSFVVSIIKDFSPIVSGSGWSYSTTPAQLPDGISINTSTGEFSGAPTTESSQNFTVVAKRGDEVSKEVINISVISVEIKVDVSATTTTTNFQSCASNAASVSTATSAYSKKQIIQEVILSTTNNSTRTTRTIVKMG
jgi:Tfp pilus assembly protein PilV